MTWKQLINYLKKNYGLKKIVWHKKNEVWSGCCNYSEGIIYLNKEKLKNDFELTVQVLLHEVGHIYCYNNGIWKNYHSNYYPIYKEDRNKVIRTGLKAERWVDCWAEKRLKELYPNYTYEHGYKNPKQVKEYRKYYLNNFKF